MKFDFLLQRQIQGELNYLDIYFAEFMADLAGTSDSIVVNTFANLSRAQSNQHSCLDLSDQPDIQDKLRALACVTVVNPAGNTPVHTPLVLSQEDPSGARGADSADPDSTCRLYLQRYHQYESNIAQQLVSRNQLINDGKDYISILNELFPEVTDGTVNWQKIAAFQSVTRNLTVITGGPGTGKTSTVVRILAALLSQNQQLKIRLAAPTGKAAARLNESIKASLTTIPERAARLIPTDVSTIHRLLGMRANGYSYKHHKHNRILTDLLVLDEVSMIDLSMLDRVLNAIAPETRLILLGDPDQLPSVDSGSIMSDLARLGVDYDAAFTALIKQRFSIQLPSQATRPPHKLTNAICHLQKSYRFADDKGIGAFSQVIRGSGRVDFTSNKQVRYVTDYTPASLVRDMLEQYQPYLKAVKSNLSAIELLKAFDNFRVLVPLREGSYGVESLNSALEALIQPAIDNSFYHGKPIIITRNDYNLRLFNGDVGICVENHLGDIEVAFRGEDGTINCYLASRLPPFEPCFVMTVHKAQGSEFDHVSLVLPRDGGGSEDLLTRELIYTGVTRARSHVDVYATKDLLMASITSKSFRFGGLTERFLIHQADSNP